MHQAAHLTPSTATSTTSLPLWMLAALAFGLSPLLSSLLLNELLASANTWLVALLHLDSRADIHLVRLISRVVLPTAVIFAVLSLAPVRRLLVMTPLALALLLVETGFFLLHVINQVSLFVLGGNGVLRQLLQGSADLVAFCCLASAMVLTGYSTAWHRSEAFRRLAASVARSWLRPL